MARRSALMVLLLGCLLWAVPLHSQGGQAYAADDSSDEVVVSVDGVDVTKGDLEAAVRDRLKSGYELNDSHEMQLLVLDSLIKEIVAEKAVTEKEISQDPALARKLEASRRQILLQHYLDKKIKPQWPALDDVKKFISGNPEYFENRKTFHYSEIIIDAGSDAKLQAVKDRLKLLQEHKQPGTPELEMLVQWLEQNKILYGYALTWKSTENLPVAIKKTLMALADGEKKIDVENKKNFFRVLALLGVYADPINPLWARKAVAIKMSEDSKRAQTKPVLDDMLSHAKIVVYDKSFKDLKFPVFRGAVSQTMPLVKKIYLAWNFAMLVFAPTALYLFFRQPRAERPEYEIPSVVDRISDHIAFRSALVLGMGALLLLPVMNLLHVEYANQQTRTLLMMALAGLGAATSTVFLCAKIDLLKKHLSSGWVALSVLFVIQLSSLLL